MKTLPVGELIEKISSMFLSKGYKDYFDIVNVTEEKDAWVLDLHEKTTLIPLSLKNEENVVLDGFCGVIEIMSHAFSLKRVLLRVYRRRWKISNTDKHYSNSYELHVNGAKLTPEMAGFFKM